MNTKLNIACIFGTRPEAIKMAPVIKCLSKNPTIKLTKIVTAQHREMLDQVLRVFGIQPDIDLSIMGPDQTLPQIIARAVGPLTTVLTNLRPDLTLVQGDTSTAFIAALASFYCRIPVGHIEAGLRTGDKFEPFPEEVNRRLISVVADLHFAPTKHSRKNLVSEGVSPDKIFVTGNTIVDAFRLALESTSKPIFFGQLCKANSKKIILVTAHRRENHGEPLKAICQGLIEIVNSRRDCLIVFPVHYNPKVRQTVFSMLSGFERIFLVDPLDYFEMVYLVKKCSIVLTDSGGIQEEAPAIGKPVLVLRDKTERPEGILAGTAKLVGTESSKIAEEVNTLLADPQKYNSMARAVNPYGDGKASERICQAILYTNHKLDFMPPPFDPGL